MDFDGDGDSDVLSGSWPGELYFFSRNDDGSFAAGEKIQNADGKEINTGDASTAFAVDWDADGDLDLITGSISGTMHLVRNDGSRTEPEYGKPVKLELGAVLNGRGGDSGPIVADWDGDGLGDLLVGMGDGSVVWFRNTGSSDAPEFGPGEELVPESPFGFDLKNARPDKGEWGARVKIHAVDYNGDGRLDLLLGDRSGSPRKAADVTEEDRKAADEARQHIPELRKQINQLRTEIAGLAENGSGGEDSEDSDAAELQKARKEYDQAVGEYSRLQEIVSRVDWKPARHGFVWLFARRSAAEVARR